MNQLLDRFIDRSGSHNLAPYQSEVVLVIFEKKNNPNPKRLNPLKALFLTIVSRRRSCVVVVGSSLAVVWKLCGHRCLLCSSSLSVCSPVSPSPLSSPSLPFLLAASIGVSSIYFCLFNSELELGLIISGCRVLH
ncbi:hypothetical protein S83_066780 [Arachis hypogaea]